eukprot:scaffold243425_cov41-Tisochrysis_lutea.AAC.2
MMPGRHAFSWSIGTYWRTHRWLGLRIYQVPRADCGYGMGAREPSCRSRRRVVPVAVSLWPPTPTWGRSGRLTTSLATPSL